MVNSTNCLNLLAFSLVVIAPFFQLPVQSATITWDGSTSTDYSVGTNWDTNTVPLLTDDVVIVDVANDPLLTADITLNSMVINSNATLGLGTFFLNFNTADTLTLGNANIISNGFISNDGGTLAITVNGSDSSTITALIVGTTAITKAGTGTLISNATHSYTGLTTITNGVLNVRNSPDGNPATGLGATVTDTTNRVTVSSGAALELQSGITFGSYNTNLNNMNITLSGTGISNGGALRNISENNYINGLVRLDGATRINSDANLLSLNGNDGTPHPNPGSPEFSSNRINSNAIQGTNQNITFGGAGNTTIYGIIDIGSGTLTKDGTGRLSLFANNTYTGTTTISAGIVEIHHSNALGTTASGTTVANGAALHLADKTLTVGAEALTLNGTGITGSGALRHLGGNNSFAGPITLASNSSINSAAGNLTLTGGVTGTNNLTIGGSGNTIISTTGITTGTASLTKTGTGTVTLNAVSTYTGNTNVEGGTFLLGASNVISNSSALTLGDNNVATPSATFATGGNSEILASLTLTENSTIDMGAGSSVLRFNTGGITNFNSNTLTVTNWTGTFDTPNGTDQIIFDSGFGLAVDSTTSQIRFAFGLDTFDGKVLSRPDLGVGFVEIVPIPEPRVYATLLLLVAFIIWIERRKLSLTQTRFKIYLSQLLTK